MARYKHIDTSPRFLAVDLERQLLPGTFEHALNYLIDHEIDLKGFDARYCNDLTGAAAYPPAMLLKVVLFAYSRGMVSSRAIERACREHVTFIALSGDSAPHFTTLAAFVSTLSDEIAPLFGEVLLLCDRQGLIGREMFAIDGVKLPSNASKAKSGTRAEFRERATKLEAAAQAMLARHRENDALPIEPDLADKAARHIKRLRMDAAQMRQWLSANPDDRKGAKGKIVKSNRSDNESAKMATSKGVIQGYVGVAAVDAQHQIIVEAQAHGTGSEQALLMPVVDATASLRTEQTLITADAGYHSDANVTALAEGNIPALIADNGMRQRDERFKDQSKHKAKPDPLYNKEGMKPKKAGLYRPEDFDYDRQAGTCICPAGKVLYQNGANCIHNGYIAVKFQGAQRDCIPCTERDKCLRTPEKTKTRQVCFFRGKADPRAENYSDIMKRAIDSPEGKALYGRRFATVEPVFGNIRYNKGLDRFTLRGQRKVDTQWKLFCLVHNIEKLAHHGYAQ
ncbi:MAG: transposase [Betaproteobacteria bacterium RIFCSPLOWO2_12_FULL_64_23]|nr:MAG: transposase [Betaproteobacteria bacterium RIFCSPLOWO2_12_FULL_64_23]